MTQTQAKTKANPITTPGAARVPVPVYVMERTPSSSSVDFSKRMRLSTAFDYFQDIAGLHADNLGAGIDTIRSTYGVTWILMRMRVEVNRMPGLEETVFVETWPQPVRTLYDRDYLIRSGSGEVLVKAVSTWIVMDLDTHDITKKKVFEYTYPIENTKRAIDCKLRQLKAPAEPEKKSEHRIAYSEVDYNFHANNARYVDFIMDSYDMSFHEKNIVSALEIDYINEARPGEVLEIKKARYAEDGTDHTDLPMHYVELSAAEDGRVVVKAKIEFAPRPR